jgi:hypothetical protein
MAAPATSGNGTARAALAHEHETEAVIATPGRRRLFRSQILGKRQRISIDNEGVRTTRGIDSRDTR